MLHFESRYLCHEQMQSISITLIGTSYCHLCEDAERILQIILSYNVFKNQQILQNKVDVIDDDNLYKNYGMKIPVVQLKQNEVLLAELYWPFDTIALNHFLKQHLPSNI